MNWFIPPIASLQQAKALHLLGTTSISYSSGGGLMPPYSATLACIPQTRNRKMNPHTSHF